MDVQYILIVTFMALVTAGFIHSLHEIISTVCDFPYKIIEK